jgi:hypothetical protein
MAGKATDASYTLVTDAVIRQDMDCFPNMATGPGCAQHKHNNEQAFLLLQTIFRDAYARITDDDFLNVSDYTSPDCPHHIRDDVGHIIERFPIAAVAINKLFEHCEEGKPTNLHTHTKGACTEFDY